LQACHNDVLLKTMVNGDGDDEDDDDDTSMNTATSQQQHLAQNQACFFTHLQPHPKHFFVQCMCLYYCTDCGRGK
jgi:hypothetical protein